MLNKVLAISLAIFSFQALAQDADPNALGWQKSAKLGTNLSLSSSKDVVGQTDGTSETYGLNLKGEFKRNGSKDEWKTETSLITSTTKTPSISRFVKSSDELKIATMYSRFWRDDRSLGPYVRAEAAAPMFKGEDVQSTQKTYAITDNNGTTRTQAGDTLKLTDAFKPLTTKESLGVFYKPINDERLKVETRVGLAALQIAADGQYTNKGTNAAGNVRIEELRDINQAGIEAAVSVKGKVDEKSGYELGIETLTPVVANTRSGDDREGLRLTNVDGFVKLTSNITSWASFGYDYKVKIQPQLVDRAQQIHMIVLNVNYNLL